MTLPNPPSARSASPARAAQEAAERRRGMARPVVPPEGLHQLVDTDTACGSYGEDGEERPLSGAAQRQRPAVGSPQLQRSQHADARRAALLAV